VQVRIIGPGEFEIMSRDSELIPKETAGKRHGPVGRSRLQKRFLLGVGLIFLCFCFISALLIYLYEKSLLGEVGYAKSQLVMAAVEANSSYVAEVLRPKMYEVLGQNAFVLEAMSTSFVSRAVMERLDRSLPEYHYRRVAVHARNPASEATEFERLLIRSFAEHSEQGSRQGIVSIGDRPHFIYSRPVHFTSSCMHCHGKPEDAPRELLDLYGRERGFGHHPGDLAGVMTVSMPVDRALARAKEKAYSVFGVSFLCLLLLYLMVNFFFSRVVVHSLKDLLDIFRLGLRDDEELQLLREAKAKDEIGDLTAAAQVLVSHLRDTRQQLEEYAQNLEVMVAERTSALEESRRRLREKVTARNRELQALTTIAELTTRAVNLLDIFPMVLRQTLNFIPAKGAGLYLIRDNPSRLELHCREHADELPATLPVNVGQREFDLDDQPTDLTSSLGEAACGHLSFFARRDEERGLNVPLCCRGKVLGVMAFTGVDLETITPEIQELLFSIGQQVGITIESLQNTQKLLQSKELLQSVFDGITDVMVLLDRDLRIKMVNKAYLKRYGATMEKALDQPCGEPHPGRVHPFSCCNVERVIRSKEPMTEEVSGSDGDIFLVHYYPILDDRGEVENIIRYARDVTAQKRVEQKIQQTERMVAMGQLAAGVAHEINNPLGVILCYADLLKRQLAGSPGGLQDLAVIEKHAMSCQRIVSDLLKFARGRETERQLTPLNRTLEEVVQMVAHQFRQHHVEIELCLDGDVPLLSIDVDKMKQVYLNLLMNARQAIKDGGKIRVNSRYLERKREVHILFWDNGSGIAPEIRERIFDPFFSTKKTGEGTGLGLSVSYGIVRDHGGEIQVESEPGRWSQFTVILPLEDRV
jgi:two-component system NtrC family sensor kinase